jgi:hypothetical protein
MADYCKQCSRNVFGEDYGDLAGLVESDNKGGLVYAICEGCEHDGMCLVDMHGACTIRKPQLGDRDMNDDTMYGPFGSARIIIIAVVVVVLLVEAFIYIPPLFPW